MVDQRRRLLRAALGFAGLPRPSYDRALWALRTWLDSWAGLGLIVGGIEAGQSIAAVFYCAHGGQRAAWAAVGRRLQGLGKEGAR